MDVVVQVAIISAAASIIIAVATFVLTKRAERADTLQKRKLEHYRELLSGISDLATTSTDRDAANLRFAQAVNTIALVAPQSVITALMNFHDEVKASNTEQTQENHDKLLVALILELRKSLDLPFEDNPSTFNFHLVGGLPSN